MTTETKDWNELSDRQQKILCFIHQHKQKHKYPPSFIEIMNATGSSSVSVVQDNIQQLAERGYLTYGLRSRTIVLEGEQYTPPDWILEHIE